jgi:hypothetical protein
MKCRGPFGMDAGGTHPVGHMDQNRKVNGP